MPPDEPERALFHIVDVDHWQRASEAGVLHPSSLDTEGFVHCSYDEQVAATLQRHYPDRDGLIVLELDPSRLGVAPVVEDTSGSGTAFPHVYAEIPVAAAIAVHHPARWLSAPGGPSGAASRDH